jgi:biopolymer transport protein ExbD
VPGPAAIREEAADLLARTPDKVFQIKADADVPCEDVGRVLDALTSAGARKILMLTDVADKESP